MLASTSPGEKIGAWSAGNKRPALLWFVLGETAALRVHDPSCGLSHAHPSEHPARRACGRPRHVHGPRNVLHAPDFNVDVISHRMLKPDGFKFFDEAERAGCMSPTGVGVPFYDRGTS